MVFYLKNLLSKRREVLSLTTGCRRLKIHKKLFPDKKNITIYYEYCLKVKNILRNIHKILFSQP